MRRPYQHSAGIVSLSVNKPDPKILQDFLVLKFALSRRAAKAAIDGRSVWVNRKCVWIARYALKTGDLVEVPSVVVKGAQRQSAQSSRENATPGALPAKRHVRVLWQDDSYLVCDKPAGLVSCDDPKSVEAILREQEKVPTLEAVHRLDRDTTGCLMFAKNHAALEAAIEEFKTHVVTKVYHAVVVGEFKFAHRLGRREFPEGSHRHWPHKPDSPPPRVAPVPDSGRQGVWAQERARPSAYARSAADAPRVHAYAAASADAQR